MIPKKPANAENARPLIARIPWIPILYVAVLAGWAGWYLTPSLFRTWFYSSDEYVIVAEVVRFLHFDFRQRFFDMPGTPLMFLSTIVWVVIYAAQIAFRMVSRGAGLEEFTFHHLPLLFTVMRAETLAFTLVSIALTFVLASKLSNRAGGCIAALAVTMSQTYMSYSSFIRVESLAVCAVLLSVLCVLHALDSPELSEADSNREARWIFAAGILAGIAAAARLHSVTASLPILLFLLLTRPELPAYPAWFGRAWKYASGAIFIGAAAAALLSKPAFLPATAFGRGVVAALPPAFELLYRASLLVMALIAGNWILSGFAATRRLANRVTHGGVLALLAGCGAGFALGTPTIFWQYEFWLRSVNMYATSYLDLDRLHWPFFRHLWWVVQFYMNVIAPNQFWLALLALGVIAILLRRDLKAFALVLSAVLFFVLRPIKIVALPHHVILWVPIFGTIMGYGVAAVWKLMDRSLPSRIARVAMLLAVLLAMRWTAVPGPEEAAKNTNFVEQRLRNVAAATDWIHHEAAPNSVVAISYVCFNSDIFLSWLRELQVPVPRAALDGRKYLIWWGQRSALKGLSGYACVSPLDLESIKRRNDLQSPGQGTDPFKDTGFQRLQIFGKGPDEIDVFHFDFSEPASMR